jgi:hypothetical protein
MRLVVLNHVLMEKVLQVDVLAVQRLEIDYLLLLLTTGIVDSSLNAATERSSSESTALAFP